jgi:hypothetical protein
MLKLKIEELTQVPWRLATERTPSNVEDVGCMRGHGKSANGSHSHNAADHL